MYSFAKNMWIMKRITEEQLEIYVNKGYLTDDEKLEILDTPQI